MNGRACGERSKFFLMYKLSHQYLHSWILPLETFIHLFLSVNRFWLFSFFKMPKRRNFFVCHSFFSPNFHSLSLILFVRFVIVFFVMVFLYFLFGFGKWFIYIQILHTLILMMWFLVLPFEYVKFSVTVLCINNKPPTHPK
jgi:hypothetical protein